MKITAILIGIGALLFDALTVVPAEAAKPPGRGYSCSALAKQIGKRNVWQTIFYGEREIGFAGWDRDWIRRAPCFKTQADCKAWLYAAQTYYWEMMEFQPCRKGGY